MLASKTSRQPSAVWQSSTKDGYTLRLTRSVLTQIISNLKQTGLEHLVHSIHSNDKSSLESAVVSAIAQVVNHATASETVSSRTFGRNLRTFTAIGKTRKYQVLTQPIDNKQSAIIFVRSRPTQEFESEYEFSDDQIENMFSRPSWLNKLLHPRRTRRERQERQQQQQQVQENWRRDQRERQQQQQQQQQRAKQQQLRRRTSQELRQEQQQHVQAVQHPDVRAERQVRRDTRNTNSSVSSVSTLPKYSRTPSRSSHRSG